MAEYSRRVERCLATLVERQHQIPDCAVIRISTLRGRPVEQRAHVVRAEFREVLGRQFWWVARNDVKIVKHRENSPTFVPAAAFKQVRQRGFWRQLPPAQREMQRGFNFSFGGIGGHCGQVLGRHAPGILSVLYRGYDLPIGESVTKRLKLNHQPVIFGDG